MPDGGSEGDPDGGRDHSEDRGLKEDGLAQLLLVRAHAPQHGQGPGALGDQDLEGVCDNEPGDEERKASESEDDAREDVLTAREVRCSERGVLVLGANDGFEVSEI